MNQKSSTPVWAFNSKTLADYRHKFENTCGILSDWFQPYGGLAGRDVLEFGCGEGTMATGIALQYEPRRMVGVEILDIVCQCSRFARQNIGLERLPDNLELHQIKPGADLTAFGKFDAIFTWSVFEHVDPSLLARAFRTLAAVLKPGGALFLQISPLFYSATGSHLFPWIPVPWDTYSFLFRSTKSGWRQRQTLRFRYAPRGAFTSLSTPLEQDSFVLNRMGFTNRG